MRYQHLPGGRGRRLLRAPLFWALGQPECMCTHAPCPGVSVPSVSPGSRLLLWDLCHLPPRRHPDSAGGLCEVRCVQKIHRHFQHF